MKFLSQNPVKWAVLLSFFAGGALSAMQTQMVPADTNTRRRHIEDNALRVVSKKAKRDFPSLQQLCLATLTSVQPPIDETQSNFRATCERYLQFIPDLRDNRLLASLTAAYTDYKQFDIDDRINQYAGNKFCIENGSSGESKKITDLIVAGNPGKNIFKKNEKLFNVVFSNDKKYVLTHSFRPHETEEFVSYNTLRVFDAKTFVCYEDNTRELDLEDDRYIMDLGKGNLAILIDRDTLGDGATLSVRDLVANEKLVDGIPFLNYDRYHFSPRGNFLLTDAHREQKGTYTYNVVLFNLRNGKSIDVPLDETLPPRLDYVDVSPDERIIMVKKSDGIALFDIEKLFDKNIKPDNFFKKADKLVFSGDMKRGALLSKGKIRVFNVLTGSTEMIHQVTSDECLAIYPYVDFSLDTYGTLLTVKTFLSTESEQRQFCNKSAAQDFFKSRLNTEQMVLLNSLLTWKKNKVAFNVNALPQDEAAVYATLPQWAKNIVI